MAEYLVAFGSTHAALSFEAAFGEDGSLVPVPPKVRAGCGMALRFFAPCDEAALQRVSGLAQELDVAPNVEAVLAKEQGAYRSLAQEGS